MCIHDHLPETEMWNYHHQRWPSSLGRPSLINAIYSMCVLGTVYSCADSRLLYSVVYLLLHNCSCWQLAITSISIRTHWLNIPLHKQTIEHNTHRVMSWIASQDVPNFGIDIIFSLELNRFTSGYYSQTNCVRNARIAACCRELAACRGDDALMSCIAHQSVTPLHSNKHWNKTIFTS